CHPRRAERCGHNGGNHEGWGALEKEVSPRRGGRPRPPGRAELFPTAHAKQQIPRTLSPRERGYKQLGMTSPTILDSLIRSAYQYATSRLSICNVPPVSLLSRWFPF